MVQDLIKDKKIKILPEKISENIGKPKKLLKIIKKIRLPDNKASTRNVCINMEKELNLSPRTIANTHKEHFVILVSDFAKKPPEPTGKLGIPSVRQYIKRKN